MRASFAMSWQCRQSPPPGGGLATTLGTGLGLGLGPMIQPQPGGGMGGLGSTSGSGDSSPPGGAMVPGTTIAPLGGLLKLRSGVGSADVSSFVFKLPCRYTSAVLVALSLLIS